MTPSTPSGLDTPFEQRFWAKVEKSDDCWVWIGSRSSSGYGRISNENGRQEQANRVAWRLANGPIPDGFDVCHHCDNPPCVRPDHLWLGTPRDNGLDMVAKGRQGWRQSRNETVCRNGHLRTATNSHRDGACADCNRERMEKRQKLIHHGRSTACVRMTGQHAERCRTHYARNGSPAVFPAGADRCNWRGRKLLRLIEGEKP